MTSADEIWNRAAMRGGGPVPRSGDVALAAALSLHNLTMSGGLVDAIGRLGTAELDAAESGYRWLGLEPAAQVVAIVRCEIGDGALDDDERAESLELRADQAYAHAVPMTRHWWTRSRPSSPTTRRHSPLRKPLHGNRQGRQS